MRKQGRCLFVEPSKISLWTLIGKRLIRLQYDFSTGALLVIKALCKCLHVTVKSSLHIELQVSWWKRKKISHFDKVYWRLAVWLAGCEICTWIHSHYPNCPLSMTLYSANSNDHVCLLCIFIAVFRWFVFGNDLLIDSYRSAYASYGGLLMRLQGDANNLHGFEVDQQIYLLIKKLAF